MNEATHLALHGVAVKKHANAAAVADLLDADVALIDACLLAAAARGRASEVGGRYLLTPAGRMIVEANYSRHYAQVRADQQFAAAHARFEAINHDLKQLITDWQTMNVGGRQVANDHSDAAYDEKIVDRLVRLHDKAVPVLEALARSLPRYTRYLARLDTALARVEDGERAWLSDATIASYHTVWFELHEDILRVLGRAREE
jgi:pyruvate,orthophosphate dikinase